MLKKLKINLLSSSCVFLSLLLGACSQGGSRKDIEEKLQGTWVGVVKDFDYSLRNKLQIKIFNKSFALTDIRFFESGILKKIVPDYEMSFRVFIHSNGDTIVERKHTLPKSLYKEPTYAKLVVVSPEEIKLIFLFKMREGGWGIPQVGVWK